MFTGVEGKLVFVIDIELSSPAHTVRYCEGGTVTFNSNVYTDRDDYFGTLSSIDNVVNGEGDQAPGFDMMWTPPNLAAVNQIGAVENQGGLVSLYVLTVNRATNAVLDSKEIFSGIIDFVVLHGNKSEQKLQLGLTTEIDRFFNTDKGNTLNDAFQKSVWPSDEGLSNCTGVLVPVPWANDAPKGAGGGVAPEPSPVTPGYVLERMF